MDNYLNYRILGQYDYASTDENDEVVERPRDYFYESDIQRERRKRKRSDMFLFIIAMILILLILGYVGTQEYENCLRGVC